MRISELILGLLAPVFSGDEKPADEPKQKVDSQRVFYAKTAAKYEFLHDLAKQQPLKLIEKPVMTWTNDGDWSGDVFVWNRGERPVWTKGTDPEVVLLLECRKTKDGRVWFYAPVRFTFREVWLTHRDNEVWRGPFHREQDGPESTMIYATRYLATITDPR